MHHAPYLTETNRSEIQGADVEWFQGLSLVAEAEPPMTFFPRSLPESGRKDTTSCNSIFSLLSRFSSLSASNKQLLVHQCDTVVKTLTGYMYKHSLPRASPNHAISMYFSSFPPAFLATSPASTTLRNSSSSFSGIGYVCSFAG